MATRRHHHCHHHHHQHRLLVSPFLSFFLPFRFLSSFLTSPVCVVPVGVVRSQWPHSASMVVLIAHNRIAVEASAHCGNE
jgi:hypothetical protein